MKLIDYFKNVFSLKKNYNDFIQINNFYFYKKLVDEKELKTLLTKHDDLELFTFKELLLYTNYKKNKIMEIFKNDLNLDTTLDYDLYVGNKKGEISKKMKIFFSNNNFTEDYYRSKPGIVILKRKIKKIKNFKKLEDLINKSNDIGLYVIKKNNDVRVIGYDNSLLSNLFKDDKEYIFPILFYGIVSTDDRIKENVPFKGSYVMNSVSRSDVSGREILYPILAYFNENKILMPDRDSISESAKSVWRHFFFKNEVFDLVDPIDDINIKITDRPEDDGRIYRDDEDFMKKEEYNLDQIKKLSEQKQIKILKKIREQNPYNWAYKLKSNYLSLCQEIIPKLEEKHNKFLKEKNNDPNFEKILIKLSGELFDKRYSN